MRGVAGAFERSWSGGPGVAEWTRLLMPLAIGYAAGAAFARRRAARLRRELPGAHVIAVGNLTVGGAGKSSVARWLASRAADFGARSAVLLRGHGTRERAPRPAIVPDFAGYSLVGRAARFGDEAAAHRIALPRQVVVVVDPDRLRGARAAAAGYGAGVVVLDDGWEQPRLRWNELWVVVDPRRPFGNGALLPAGSLRRPITTLREATRIVSVLETPGENVPDETRAKIARLAPEAPLLRLRRVLHGISPIGAMDALETPRAGSKVALLSAVGSPERLERFARGAGLVWSFHAAFPDHAEWTERSLAGALRKCRAAGAEILLLTEKDEARWPRGMEPPLPVRVLRTDLIPLDPMDAALAPLREAVAARGAMG